MCKEKEVDKAQEKEVIPSLVKIPNVGGGGQKNLIVVACNLV